MGILWELNKIMNANSLMVLEVGNMVECLIIVAIILLLSHI